MNELTLLQIITPIIGRVLPLIFAITVHEVAHGWVAKQYGDNTASLLGRLTLNPIKHIDLVGTIIVPALLLISGTSFVFGWAKPVPVNPNNFKNPRADMAVVALAGPAANLLMAIFWALIAYVGAIIGIRMEAIASLLIYTGFAGIAINLALALLNLLPIPPLDGSRIVSWLLPRDLARQYNKLERFGFVILLILLSTHLLNPIFDYPIYLTQKLIASMVGL